MNRHMTKSSERTDDNDRSLGVASLNVISRGLSPAAENKKHRAKAKQNGKQLGVVRYNTELPGNHGITPKTSAGQPR